MGILRQKAVNKGVLNTGIGLKRKKGFTLVEVIIATSIITFIIFTVMQVYYVNKKAEEQNQIGYMIDESISEIVPIELLKLSSGYPVSVNNENNTQELSQGLVSYLNGIKDQIRDEINRDLNKLDKQVEIKDINFSYITDRKEENKVAKIDNQNGIVKTYIRVEYNYKTKYSIRKKIIKLPMYSYYYRRNENLWDSGDPPRNIINPTIENPRDSVSLSVDRD